MSTQKRYLKKRFLKMPPFLWSLTAVIAFIFNFRVCASELNREQEKLKIILNLKQGNDTKESRHELVFDEKAMLFKDIEINGEHFNIELLPKKIESAQLKENSSFLVEVNISKFQNGQKISLAKPFLSIEYGGQAKILHF
jgi:hypothetical protein